jgi:hypothetical protein
MSLSTYDLSLWEISRRALRSEKLRFSFERKTKIDLQKLSNAISDSAPSIILEMDKDEKITGDQIIIRNNGKIIGLISQSEPRDTDCLWIPNEINKFWNDFEKRVLHLVEAGYPGCIGCGGPGSNNEWDEEQNRIEFRELRTK